MRRILILGAARHQVPAIEAALAEGMKVFTADNRPENPGHLLAEKSYCVSAADPAAVEELARALHVNGVLGYASEICARTAAVVAERLGLPGPPVSAVENLSIKSKFRSLADETGANALVWRSFMALDALAAEAFARSLPGGCVVKPVDNSGGRGVSVQPLDFREAFTGAVAASGRGRVIVEEFVSRKGSQVGGDGWMEDGRLKFVHFFDNATLPAPANAAAVRETFPSSHSLELLGSMRRELELLLQTAGYNHGPFNFDGCFREDGRPFVFEIAPRNGGNFIPQVTCWQTGVDLTRAAVLSAMDRDFRPPFPAAPPLPRFHSSWMLHANKPGIFRGVQLAPELVPSVLECILYKGPGARVGHYQTSGDMLGILLMEFSSAESMKKTMENMVNLCTVEIDV